MTLKLQVRDSFAAVGPWLFNADWSFHEMTASELAGSKHPMAKEFAKVCCGPKTESFAKKFCPNMAEMPEDFTKSLPELTGEWIPLKVNFETGVAARFDRKGKMFAVGVRLPMGGFAYVKPSYAPLLAGPWVVYAKPLQKSQLCVTEPLLFLDGNGDIVGSLQTMDLTDLLKKQVTH